METVLAAARADGESLLANAPKDESEVAGFRERYLSWEARTSAVLENSFKVSGFLTTSPKDEFTGTAVSLLDLKIASTIIPWERLPEVVRDIREKVRVLGAIQDRLDVYTQTPTSRIPRVPSADAPIFLVHGHDLARREIVRRFLETVTRRDVVVLADQPNRGQDVLGKLLTHALQAAFAVVLLTPDDAGCPQGAAEPLPRARQNVVFELGMFIGILGRERVAALNEPSVEIPTDFSGVAYIAIEGEAWQIELARELKAAGIAVSLDRVI
ncbi:nucleotide-binding protein [Arsenicicoccus bolidensis]|uniref:Nucleotide-binding protein n=2 Tax=Arsenicicoccus bolidensis TaxID=229480 RepID=A0ABS9Q6D2_9MICO|nr:nucleotide-binding protein [Arsenicicoccus bolidensis]